MTGTIFERYGDLSGDRALFREAATTPLPTTVWANAPLWPAARNVLEGLERHLTPLAWREDAYRIADPSAGAFIAARMLGALHIQEEAAMIPVRMLAPGGDERVLDACAAPGNKTAAIAASLGPDGRVVAVDVNAARMGVLRTSLNTLGLTSVAGVLADASDLSERVGLFDAAMVDAPCSCEGTSRKHSDVVRCLSSDARSALADHQLRILRSAIRRVRPGGRIVYATCTYAPEENESVVSSVVERPDPGHDVRILPYPIPGIKTAAGLTAWNGRTYPGDMEHAVRLWPHQSDTGGFFSVLLEKVGGKPFHTDRAESVEPSSSRPVRARDEPWSAYDFDKQVTAGLMDLRSGSKYSSLLSAALATDPVLRLPRAPSGVPNSIHPALLFAGMRGVNIKSHLLRPSTAMAVRFGGAATRGVIEIRREDVMRFLRRERIPIIQFTPPTRPTPVAIVRANGCALGLGRIDSSSPNEVRSLFPKVRAGISVARTLEG